MKVTSLHYLDANFIILVQKLKKNPKNTNGRLAIPALAGLLVLLCFRQTRLVGGITLSTRPVHLLPNLWTRYFENEWTNFDANWRKWSAGQGHETINFSGTRSKVKVKRGRVGHRNHPFGEISEEIFDEFWSNLVGTCHVNCPLCHNNLDAEG